jgi:Bifunctional DNA primase/polymerase, N-terminal/Primase C terminal 1 (PriCT-1)
MSDTPDHALAYAHRGWPCFPVKCVRGAKQPLTAHGFKDATTDEATLIEWFARRWPAAGIGIPTGRASGIVVLDIDPPDGAESYNRLRTMLGDPPTTRAVKTPSGGFHFHYVAPEVELRNSAGALGRGLDVRGEGGYVVVPPSTDPIRGSWTWVQSGALAELPANWVEVLASAPLPEPTPNGKVVGAPPEAWSSLVGGLIPEGERNDSLARLIGHLLRRDVHVYLVRELACAVNDSRCRPPLDRREVERIVDSIAARELRRREALS